VTLDVYVPYDDTDPKARLSPLLDEEERVEFVRACLDDVCDAVEATSVEATPVILSTRPLDVPHENVVRDEPLTPAVNAVLSDTGAPVGVVVADLPLATPEALDSLFSSEAGFAVVPGRGGGTNAFVARDPRFRVDYHGTSVTDHTETARELGLGVEVVDSFRLFVDADEPEDLVDVLLHGEGDASGFLRERFEAVENEEERVELRRR